MTDARTPSEKLRIARDTHSHSELINGGGKRAPLFFTRWDFGTEQVSRWLSTMHKQDRHDDRALAAPGLIAELRQYDIDLGRIEIDDELVRPVIGSLVVVQRDAGHHINIVEAGDETIRMDGELCGARLILEPRVARRPDEDVAQSLGKTPRALAHVCAGNDRIGLVHWADVRRARTFRFGRHKPRPQIVSVRRRRSRALRAGTSGGWLRLGASQRRCAEQLQKRHPPPHSNRVPGHLSRLDASRY